MAELAHRSRQPSVDGRTFHIVSKALLYPSRVSAFLMPRRRKHLTADPNLIVSKGALP